ncbi:hypothetical protein [Spirosoma koreense]
MDEHPGFCCLFFSNEEVEQRGASGSLLKNGWFWPNTDRTILSVLEIIPLNTWNLTSPDAALAASRALYLRMQEQA